MKLLLLGFLTLATAGGTLVLPDATEDQAIKNERKKFEGVWRVVAMEINGNKAGEEDARKITVTNDAIGGWILRVDDKEITRGTNKVDPAKKPKTIDFTPTEGDTKGQVYVGIYEISADTRKLCFAAPGKDRPTEFASQPGSEHFLVQFERVKEKK